MSLLNRLVARIRTQLERVSGLFKGPDEVDLTSGEIAKPLFFLSLPIVVTNLLQTAYNLIDTFWLGQYSTTALAAISFAFPMVFLLISVGMGLSVAGSVLVAQHIGAGEEAEAEYAASQTVVLSLVGATLIGVVGYGLVDDLLALLGASEAVLPPATEYMQVISLGMAFMFGFFVFIALMRGYGDTVTPMLVMFGSVLLNVVLDPFLIFGWGPFPELGIQGAAVATVFSRALALVVGLAIMFRGRRGVRIRLGQMWPDLSFAKKLVGIGFPASIEGMGRALSINLLLVIVAIFPDTVVAAYGVGTRVFSVIFLPAVAVARGVETMTGQNIGAGEPDRAKEAADFAARTMFLILGALGVVAWIAAEPIMAAFTDNTEVVDVGVTFLRYVAPTFGFIGIMRSYNGSFRGAGKTLTAAGIVIVIYALVRLPVAAGLAQTGLGSRGIWIAFAVSNVLGAGLTYVWYRRGTWRDADVRDAAPGPGPGPQAGDDRGLEADAEVGADD
ncbi:MATE family efflux transporter [Halopiger xanaduensis]|uniref:MATE efflux family protein n=1 Tax=Halopiger xanaduensis (strain DSM 18323 / JCM 14033 / SH-6) TaxID=797210 RepID=F8D632_HALXS|nr:MATE family efflux transporter [Halopiger xanaduensis]AEH38892.1 MATE efflux family protein [Halopiger xanaduensis SH-6]